MSALSPRTKDGAYSVAAACEAHALRQLDTVPVAPAELAAWARDNGVDLRVAGEKLPLVNARRNALGLPPFKVIRPVVEQVFAGPKVPLIAATEAELLEMVRTLVCTKIGAMTPECAGWSLKLVRGEHPADKHAVARFTSIIQQGLWKNTAEPIVFSRDGWLNDGRSRLTAIVQAGTAVEVDVRFGIDPSAFEATNTGAPRKAADALYILGAQHSVAQAALARLLYLYDQGKLGATAARVVETSHIVATIGANTCIPAIAEFMANSPFAPTRTAPFGLVMAAGARLSSLDRAMEFGHAVAAGRDADRTPTRTLHVRLRDLRMSKGKKPGTTEVAVLAAKAWNGWATGKPFNLKVSPADLLPGGFPLILAPKDTGRG